MAWELHIVGTMRVVRFLLFIIFLIPCPASLAAPQQEPAGVNARGIVEKAEISGIDENDLSDDVRKAVHNLEGKAFDQHLADDLVLQIQAEKPALIATTRLLPGSKSDLVKVVFVVEKSNEEAGGGPNVNSRYTVERVEVQGFDESRLSQTIRGEMQKLVGEKLNHEKANQILQEINRELRPKYTAARKLMKGSDPQHIVVVYEIHKARLIPFVDIPPERIVYHSKQGFSADLNVDEGKINRFFFGVSDDQDQLIERFA